MTEPQTKPDFRWLLVIQLYVAIITWGVIQVFTQHAGLYYLFALYIAAVAAIWTVADARLRGRPIRHIVQLLILFSWPIAVPIYLVWSRGVRGMCWSVVHAVGLMATANVGFYLTLFFVHGVEAFTQQS